LPDLSKSFGVFSPRSLAEIQEQALRLPQVGDQLDTHAKAWKATLGDANRANLGRFLSKQPAWAEPVSERALREGGASARELAGSFLYDLGEHTRGDSWMERRRSRIAWRCGWGGAAPADDPRHDRRAGVPLGQRDGVPGVRGRPGGGARGAAGVARDSLWRSRCCAATSGSS
jgi:hypothetical protein